MAGYSGTPLVKKLGIKPGHRVALISAPRELPRLLGALPEGARIAPDARGREPFDVMLLFVESRAELARRFDAARKKLDPAGGLWIAWPKKSSGVSTDMTENVARDTALAAGLVDNKVCAIDDVWSGLRCVVRLENRPPRPAAPGKRGAGKTAPRS